MPPNCKTKGCPHFGCSNLNGGYYDKCRLSCGTNSKTVKKIPICSTPGCIRYKHLKTKDSYHDKCHKYCEFYGVQIIKKSSEIYSGIENQFKTKWWKGECPPIISIHEIFISSSKQKNYQNYQSKIHDKMKKEGIKNFNSFAGPGNELRRFHGCTQTCSLGFPNGTTGICKNGSKGCNVCGIIENGFLISKCTENTGWARFGNGIYLTSISSKSNDYNHETLKYSKNYKSVLLCQVIHGKVKKETISNPELSKKDILDQKFDSVVGIPGKDLNNDEIVIYDENAVIPKYLIIY
jgi:hypothetical protein